MRLILASKSATRKKALNQLGLKYEIIPSNFDEKSIRNDDPHKLVEELSQIKAKIVGDNEDNSIVIAGDLFVVFEGKIYEKPKSEAEAFDMLKAFSGSTLHILVGLAVYNSKIKKMYSVVKDYEVEFRELLDSEIQDYIYNYPVIHFAGGFNDDGLKLFAKDKKDIDSSLKCIPEKELIDFLRKNNFEI
jgi:septum formation protein